MFKAIPYLFLVVLMLSGGKSPAVSVQTKEKQGSSKKALDNPYYHLILAQKYSAMYKVPLNHIRATIRVESHGDSAARSKYGCVGLMQLEPATAVWLGCIAKKGDGILYTPEVNVRCGVTYLKYLHDRYGDWELAHWAYNFGPARVDALRSSVGARSVAYVRSVKSHL